MPIATNGAPGAKRHEVSPTNVLVLRDGHIYFEASAEEFGRSADNYLKQFLAAAT